MYVLENPDGRFYVGSTDDLDRRVSQHNTPADRTKYTHKHGPWKLVWNEAHPTPTEAVRREREIKSMKSAKWIREHLLNR